jgi:hypothetical protein
MARQWRIEYERLFYHVMSRGNEGRAITSDDDDREVFLSVLGEMSGTNYVFVFPVISAEIPYEQKWCNVLPEPL